MARTTSIFARNDNGYFAANLDDGGVRVGLENVCCLSVSMTHELYQAAIALTDASVEEFFDEKVFPALYKKD